MTTLSVSKPASMQTSFFDDFVKPWRDWVSSFYDGSAFNALTIPAANVTEDKDSYKLSLAAPGMKKEDFKIQLEGNILTVSAEKEEKKEEKNEKYRRQEYNYSSFSRSFNVPESISKDKIEAHYEEGVLKLKMPKNEEGKKNGKSIAIAVK